MKLKKALEKALDYSEETPAQRKERKLNERKWKWTRKRLKAMVASLNAEQTAFITDMVTDGLGIGNSLSIEFEKALFKKG